HLALAHATAGADPAAVLPGCRALADGLGTGVGPLITDPGVAPLVARVLLAAGDRRRAGTVLDAASRLATLNPRVPGWSAGRLHVTGLTTGATAAMRAAAGQFTEAGRHFAAAVALADAALLGLNRGEPEARRWLDEAGRALRAMGATAVLADLLRRGPGDGAATRPDRTGFGWNSLTGAELRVVLLAATGASNKEIARQLWLSPHTVGTHVRHALGKLGLRSRVEMARQAGERGITGAAGVDRKPVLAYETH
ncbi:MAG: response regulator transcription factor, partial [Catenulispora sp.]